MAGLPRWSLPIVLAVLTVEAAWVVWTLLQEQTLWLPVALFCATIIPLGVATVLHGGASKALMAMARSGFSVATGLVIGVPVYLVWMMHDTWAAALSEWSVALVLVVALAVASLLLGRAVAAGNRR